MLSFGSLLALEDASLSTTATTVGGTTTESSQQQQLLCQDILVCGVCEREFALADILKFISHKVNSCSNKENCRIRTYNNTSDDECDDAEDATVISGGDNNDSADSANNDSSNSPVINLRKQTPSIISTSQRHKLIKLRHHRVHHNRSQLNATSCQSSLSPSTPGEKTTVDAHTNTANTGN